MLILDTAIAAAYRKLDVENVGRVPFVEFWQIVVELTKDIPSGALAMRMRRSLGLTITKRRAGRPHVTWNQRAAAFCKQMENKHA